LEARDVEELQETLERLRVEVAELNASRRELVLAADADRRAIERNLHEGVQQHLVAFAVKLQLADELTDSDPAAAKALLEEMEREVQHALDETAHLAQRIYPPLLEAGGLAAALRAAATSARISASIEVAADASYPPEVVRTIYLCWLEALEGAPDGARATIAVREEQGSLVFDVADDGADSGVPRVGSDAGPDGLRVRVEALGGRLTIGSKLGGGNRVSGWLPLSR
jgi:signal transduction histidine kinase